MNMIVKDLFAYNWDCRRKFLMSMAELSWETVTENIGASFDCIRNIFVHSLQAELSWIRLLSKKSPAGIWETPFSKFASVKDLEEYADEVESKTNE